MALAHRTQHPRALVGKGLGQHAVRTRRQRHPQIFLPADRTGPGKIRARRQTYGLDIDRALSTRELEVATRLAVEGVAGDAEEAAIPEAAADETDSDAGGFDLKYAQK
jgi:hypothetical protein